tara:strand:+ start:198 stop:500 length:303 start_codon:yes stop_codon:yes gene_type:complete
MDRELDEQIDELIHKATKDLKTRIARVVVRHQNKLLKEQARELKSWGGTGGRMKTAAPSDGKSSGGRKSKPTATTSRKSSVSNKDSKYHSDSDSDGYYSD